MDAASRNGWRRLLVAALFALGVRAGPAPDSPDPWSSIMPSDKLEWHPCLAQPDNNSPSLCARLTVPMDYERPSGSAKVQVALLLKPSNKTLRGVRNARSPLLLNPGGPGGSGTQFALQAGAAMRTVMGGGEEQDVIGFDPRGVGATTPGADCWTPLPPDCQGNGKASQLDRCEGSVAVGHGLRAQWAAAGSILGTVNSSSDALRRHGARFRAVNSMCRVKDAQAGGDEGSILRYASTPFVARDMLSIVDAWDAWQETLADEGRAQQPQNPGAPTKGKLVYWGVSYGSYLGATFAKLFPDRVGRVAIDGVVNPYLFGGQLWAETLHDTDAGLSDIFRHCFQAGARCQFRRASDAEPADVERRFWALLDRLDRDPPVFTTLAAPQTPVLVTSDLLKRIVFRALYNPTTDFAPVVDRILSLLYDNRAEEVGDVFRSPDLHQSLCNLTATPTWTLQNDALIAVGCGDKREPINDTVAQIQAKFERHAANSRFADVWTEFEMMCNQWGIPSASQRHPSPWDPSQVGSATETAFPLLVLSNTYDPVTPLVSGLNMTTAFKGAGFVEQRCGGHCTITAASACTARILREYFIEGKVPPPPGQGNWTTCEVDELPWQERPAVGARADGGSEDGMLDQLKVVRDALRDVGGKL